jgi:hypothetical protein
MVRDVAAYHGTGNWVFVSGEGCAITVGHPGAYHTEPTHQ